MRQNFYYQAFLQVVFTLAIAWAMIVASSACSMDRSVAYRAISGKYAKPAKTIRMPASLNLGVRG
jgi:hypothetical protein